jgi:hypothetical protein
MFYGITFFSDPFLNVYLKVSDCLNGLLWACPLKLAAGRLWRHRLTSLSSGNAIECPAFSRTKADALIGRDLAIADADAVVSVVNEVDLADYVCGNEVESLLESLGTEWRRRRAGLEGGMKTFLEGGKIGAFVDDRCVRHCDNQVN